MCKVMLLLVTMVIGATGLSFAQSSATATSAPATRPAPSRWPRVWAISDGFRVDPLTGRVREHQRVDGDPLPAGFVYQHRNTIWDADAKRVVLKAARNEVVAFQLQIQGPASGVAVQCSDLKGPATIRADQDVAILKQWYLHVAENSSNQDSTTAAYHLGTGWYADALIPADAGQGYGLPFDIPDRNNAVAGQQWQGVWLDIYVPRDVPAGTYRGSLTVSGAGLDEPIALVLEVYDVTLSDEYACEVGLNNYGGIGLKGSETRLRYFQMAHRHRMAIHEHYIQVEVAGEGADMRGRWDAYGREMGKYLSGEAFTAKHGYRGPGEGQPLRWLYLPFDTVGSHAWPMAKDRMKTPEYDQAVLAMLHDFARHFAQKGWTRTNLMFFINGLDEPKTLDAVSDIRYFGELVRQAGARNVHYRADINHLHDMDRYGFGWTEQTMLDELGPVIDLWCCVADFKRTDFSVLLPRRNPPENDVVWFYQNREPSVGGYTLDDETIGLRTWPVFVWKYGLDGCILWELTFVGPSKDIWVDPRNSVYEGRLHNLAGFLAYPARPGVVEPVASIRMKNFRRGAQDYEYLRILESIAGRAAAEAILAPVVPRGLHRPERPYGAPGSWSHNPERWECMRIRLLDAIVAAKRPGA